MTECAGMVCIDCEVRERARRAEREVRKLTADMQELLAERRDLKAMLADAGIRNEVLTKRLKTVVRWFTMQQGRRCPSKAYQAQCDAYEGCHDCWASHVTQRLSQEVRA